MVPSTEADRGTKADLGQLDKVKWYVDMQNSSNCCTVGTNTSLTAFCDGISMRKRREEEGLRAWMKVRV